MPPTSRTKRRLVVGKLPLTLEDVADAAEGVLELCIDSSPAYQGRLEQSREILDRELARGGRVYGVTTGFGDSSEIDVSQAGIPDLPLQLVRFHGCGTGAKFGEPETIAFIVARLASLCLGNSAVRRELLERLARMVNERICPLVPQEGSVGASGDLTPLSYVAAALIGERDVMWRGCVMTARQALDELGLEPLVLQPKESLALMNGTSVMTGLGCLAFCRARRLVRFGATLTAMLVDAVRGNPAQFDDGIFRLKPHPGQRACARWIREDLGDRERLPARLQDRYSIRCAPHILGVLADTLPWARTILETELNSANDNPLVDFESERVLHGGNFYGGHVCQVMDTLKVSVANLADLFDRQLALLCNPTTNHGLPANLSGGGDRSGHHGFKAVQIGSSALTAEALKLTMPASVFSRSTENHNQDKVSLGTIAARDCSRILDLTETAASMHLLALCQALELRAGTQRTGQAQETATWLLCERVRRLVPALAEDRAMDRDIERVLVAYRSSELGVAPADFG